MAWFSNDKKRPNLDLESFNLFIKLLDEKRYSARNPGDMNSLEKRLKTEGYPKGLTDAIVWRFRNVAGLC